VAVSVCHEFVCICEAFAFVCLCLCVKWRWGHMFCTGIVCETSFEFKGLMCHDGGRGAWVVLDTGKVFSTVFL